ncbi:hypothetical protein COCC4DRAFT_25287 [Bipolaris maydis ATCC 48331]|uniref:F-box domain-containing protein n=2 Tax=Cochliobolus heterostrophus TaxID=5016 RepID=M2SMY8_COCH5|nr:uncharacterized protein COCC4DRAFT_25287 [Bipolaris maydis ATCC 48331]EMD86705.1 hypothetical protein COCHEDRAFT_1034477 [Bipolaris maydis C5]KAJ5042647.1 hypothetical protein J3E74DRAFT_296237 [Bipolaris maydis]ENI03099.1 hypothetical protein COCC4DRAFT_25287 [Bipolaris maydis ATCC 48331]KAJ5052565.1 hypothetical protein J3E74DRAFT_412082 [Bipolaris maydis]KAJ6191844.1 hypothetical protein J3E72DRAFT_380634 [Bipolaris maydis]
MEQSLLFRLPRELRDEIYKYALYHAGGLLYTIGKNGVGRLCRKARNNSSRKSVLAKLYDRSRRIAKAQAQRHGIDYNQLKHVCRQLRDESSALSPHGNVVFTKGSSTMNAFEQCLILFQQFPKVRSVAIKCCESFASESSQGKLFETIQKCAGHARVSVRVHIPHWSLADPDFIFRGLFYLYSLRNDATLVSRLARVSPVTYLSNSASEILTVDRPIPKNVRFYPWNDTFDQQLFEQIRQKQLLFEHPQTQAAIGNIEGLARAWIENGL